MPTTAPTTDASRRERAVDVVTTDGADPDVDPRTVDHDPAATSGAPPAGVAPGREDPSGPGFSGPRSDRPLSDGPASSGVGPDDEAPGPDDGGQPQRRSPARRPPLAAAECRNEVRLRGRISGDPVVRELPSGDVLTSWRVVVARSPAPTAEGTSGPGAESGTRPRRPTSDTVDCAAWSPEVAGVALGLGDGALVEVTGALRRRFWRAGGGPVSRVEVEVTSVSAAPPPTADAPGAVRGPDHGAAAGGD